jgi:inner membrane protein
LPSPLAHAAAGYAICKVATSRKIGTTFRRIGPLPILLAIIVILSFLPDFDFIPGIIVGDYDAFHNSYSNSLIVGLLLALLIGFIARINKSARFIVWFLIILAAYELHVLMDYFGADRGAMLFWPLTEERFVSPVKLFYGLHRSDGLWSIRHVWTVLTEAVFAAVVVLLVNFLWRPKASSKKGSVREFVPTDNESAL